jgi:hypothetical protein
MVLGSINISDVLFCPTKVCKASEEIAVSIFVVEEQDARVKLCSFKGASAGASGHY